MNSATPSQPIAQRNLRLSPYVAVAGGMLAIILSFWAPLCISYLALALGVGSMAFYIEWIEVRRHTYLGPLANILTIVAFMVGQEFLVPRDFTRGAHYICTAQFLGVWMFSFAVSHLVFRKKLQRYFANDAA